MLGKGPFSIIAMSDGKNCARIPHIIDSQNQQTFFTPGVLQSGLKALFLFVMDNYDVGNAFPAKIAVIAASTSVSDRARAQKCLYVESKLSKLQ